MPLDLTGIGAVLSGLGSVAAALVSARAYHRAMLDECRKRIREMQARERRWSHLP